MKLNNKATLFLTNIIDINKYCNYFNVQILKNCLNDYCIMLILIFQLKIMLE